MDARGILERDPPRTLPAARVTVLLPYGSLFFAAARTLEQQLPDVGAGNHAVVLLLLRGLQLSDELVAQLEAATPAPIRRASCAPASTQAPHRAIGEGALDGGLDTGNPFGRERLSPLPARTCRVRFNPGRFEIPPGGGA